MKISFEASRQIVFGASGMLFGAGIWSFITAWLAFSKDSLHSRVGFVDFIVLLLALVGAFAVYIIPRRILSPKRSDEASFDFEGNEDRVRGIKRIILIVGFLVTAACLAASVLRYSNARFTCVRDMFALTPLKTQEKGPVFTSEDIKKMYADAEPYMYIIEYRLRPRALAIASLFFVFLGTVYVKLGAHPVPEATSAF